METTTREGPHSDESSSTSPPRRPARRPNESFWAVTSYFNPVPYRRRLENYRHFRDHLALPLLTVELGYDGRFELGPADADMLVQISGGDVLWQKERLINLAIESLLPPECDTVAWIDCDSIFATADWPEEALRGLERARLVQLYSTLAYLDRSWAPGRDPDSAVELRRESLAAAMARGLSVQECLSRPARGDRGVFTKGLAWAARRETIGRHRLFDATILGGGDSAMAHAICGLIDQGADRLLFNERQRQHYHTWALPFFESFRDGVAVVDRPVYHLWHGDLADRGVSRRHQLFSRFQFDPYRDIGVDSSGAWCWTSEKPEMHAFVRQYFASRREDG